MNPILHLTFVYFPEDTEEPVVVGSANSPVVPRIGDTLLLDEADVAERGGIVAWEVIDVFFQLPKMGTDASISEITVYIDPSEDDEDVE